MRPVAFRHSISRVLAFSWTLKTTINFFIRKKRAISDIFEVIQYSQKLCKLGEKYGCKIKEKTM
jgi:hypothetical protein